MNTRADFALTADQQMVRDAAEAYLTERCTSEAVRKALETANGYDESIWKAIAAELGWAATHVPEANGGIGLGWIELTLILEQMGRRLLCSPFFSTAVMGATTLIECGSPQAKDSYLPRIASGELTVTVGLGGSGIEWDPARVTAIASGNASGYSIKGSFRHVPDGASASLLLLVARLGGELALFAVPRDRQGLRATEHDSIDRTRRVAQVDLDDVPVPADALIAVGADLEQSLSRVHALCAIALAAEQLGVAQQCLDLTLTYASERVQFGRTINAFQAVKHRCAEMMVKIEATRSAVFGASRAAAESIATDDLLMEAACVKTFASDTAYFCAQEAIQLHGGVGFTWEYDPHLYFKRAQASSHWFGSPDRWRQRVADTLLGVN